MVAGRLEAPPQGWGVIDLPIIVDWPNRPLRIVDHQSASPALPAGACWGTTTPAKRTRVELEPVTGRSHQLRVHLRELGHPILGDALYAPPEVQALSGRLLLHACSLSFVHPLTGKALAFESAAPF